MSGKLTKALPFPADWTMREGAHFSGGREWFGYRNDCIQEPRLSRFDRYTRKDRSVTSTWRVDGLDCASAEDAWTKLQTPPVLTQDEIAILAQIGDEPADYRGAFDTNVMHWLRCKGAIAYGPPRLCCRTPAGLALLTDTQQGAET